MVDFITVIIACVFLVLMYGLVIYRRGGSNTRILTSMILLSITLSIIICVNTETYPSFPPNFVLF